MDRQPLGRVSVAGVCPRCGQGKLFEGLIKLKPRCTKCGLDFGRFNIGDGPAAFLILLVGALVAVGAIWTDLAFAPPLWAHLVWVPVTLVLTLGGLRVGKAAMIRQEYVYHAREGRIRR